MLNLKDVAVYYAAEMAFGHLMTGGVELRREPVDGGYMLRFTGLEVSFFVIDEEVAEFRGWFDAMPFLAQSALRMYVKEMLQLAHAEIDGVLKPDWWRQSGRIRQGQFRERFVVLDMMGVGR